MPSLLDFQTYGYSPGCLQFEVLRAIHLHGGITAELTESSGFTRKGIPSPELRELITKRIVAPRVLTSQPLRIVWQLKSTALNRQTDMQIVKEVNRLRIKEHAQGGFTLELRPALAALKR